ncbi:MAG: TlpA family protein disulfide reductase [Bacteroidales bacterium]|jgi:peroxiredoxin|nr:TlpA family protein disulfide reductase [Bacteroidales bacterium]
MKRSFILSVVAFLVSCGQETPIYIKGELSGSNGDTIFLQQIGIDKQSTSIDTIKLDDKGHFSVKYTIAQPAFYSLTANHKSITLLLHPKDKITVTGDVRHLLLTYDVEGSKDSKEIRELSFRLEQTGFIRDSLNKSLQQYVGNRNFVNIRRQFEWNYLRELDSLRACNIRFIRNNPQSLAIIYALYQQVEPNFFLFNQEDDIRYFQKADSVLYKKYPKVPQVQMLHNNTLEMAEKNRISKLNRMLYMLGQDAPEIALPSNMGKIEKLTSLRGEYVLLNFWASWNPPSRENNKELVKIFEKYRNQKFNIFQVSLDNSKAAWEKAIKEDGLIWKHVCDFKYWDSEVVKEYNIENIPANFLIDMEGTIISKELRGNALEQKLSELFADAR